MAVYAALIPLKSKIRTFLKHYDACFEPSSLELTHYLYKEIMSFQEFVERMAISSRKRMNALPAQVKEAITKFCDLLSAHLSNQRPYVPDSLGLSEGEDNEEVTQMLLELLQEEEEEKEEGSIADESNQMSNLIDLTDIKQHIHSFIEALKKAKEEYDDEEEDNSPSSRIDFFWDESKMVGLSDLHAELKECIIRKDPIEAVKLFSIVGMAGIGKTTLAKKLYVDSDFIEWFDCLAWMSVGREWQLHNIIMGIIAQVNPDYANEMLSMVEYDDDRINECLKECLKGKRYLIVLDDVWEKHVWDDLNKLLKNKMKNAAGSRVLITTRIQQVVDPTGLHSGLSSSHVRLLNKEESWDLLRAKVFAEDSCSFQLERAGRVIAEKCDGLPLTIIKVANLLSESEKTLEYWNKVATQKKHQLFVATYDQVSKVLYPSYENLPQHLKMCLLYLGVFPQNNEIPKSKIINMWLAEGLNLQENTEKSLKKHALKCLDELASNNVMVYKKSTKSSSKMSIYKGIKAGSLHSSWWHFCYKEGRKNNFFYVLSNREDSLEENIKGQSRLSVHNNILLAIKEVFDSMKDNCAYSAQSLLFYGPYNRYPVPICSAFKLLKVLDALNIRFYDFPLQVVGLVKLKYLALTYDGELPPSISKLQELQFLIVCPQQIIKSCGANLCLPSEIWDIKELKHLQVTGSDLPDYWGNPLPNIVTLLDLSANSCTKGVFKRVYNLSKLGIQIELQPDNSDEPLNCLDHVSILRNLKSLKCVVVNPEFRSELVPPPTLSNLPLYLKKLALSGMGYPWSEMRKVASLKNLQVLKLRRNAFQGSKWEIEENSFPDLQYLLLEDCDLEHWIVGCGSFKGLEHLSIKHCYNLREIDWECEDNISMIEIDDCDPVVEKLIKEAKWGKGMLALDFHVHYSWNDGKLKS